MTKQQLKDYGQTIGVQLNLKNKKDELITQLNEAVEQKAELNSTPVPTEQAPPFSFNRICHTFSRRV